MTFSFYRSSYIIAAHYCCMSNKSGYTLNGWSFCSFWFCTFRWYFKFTVRDCFDFHFGLNGTRLWKWWANFVAGRGWHKTIMLHLIFVPFECLESLQKNYEICNRKFLLSWRFCTFCWSWSVSHSHDICQIFYTSTFSKIERFTPKKIVIHILNTNIMLWAFPFTEEGYPNFICSFSLYTLSLGKTGVSNTNNLNRITLIVVTILHKRCLWQISYLVSQVAHSGIDSIKWF